MHSGAVGQPRPCSTRSRRRRRRRRFSMLINAATMQKLPPPKSETPKRACEESAADRTRVLGSGPAAKAPRQFVRDKDGAIKVGDISDNGKRKVQVKKWSNRVLVDVREYYEKDGAMLPGKKGISLTLPQYRALAASAAEIDAEIEALEAKAK